MPGLPRDGDAVYFAVHPVAGTERQCNYCGTPGGAERRCRRCCCWQEFLSGRVFAAKATAALAWAVNHQMYAMCMHAWKQQRQPIGNSNSCGGGCGGAQFDTCYRRHWNPHAAIDPVDGHGKVSAHGGCKQW